MQQPTLTNVHVRTIDDAHKLFYAVELGKLPKIEKRLDSHERAALRPGNVYVWEEKPPSADNYSVTMERFTEGKSWTASRVRCPQEFLMYYESPAKKKKGDRDESTKPRTAEDQVVREGERDLYIKLTYSAYRASDEPPPTSSGRDKDKKKPRKWHLNAYFTKFTEGQLQTIDEIPMLRDLVVPEGMYKTARSTGKSNKNKSDASKDGDRSAGKPSGSSSVQRVYAPFPSSHPSTRMPQPYPAPAVHARPDADADDLRPGPPARPLLPQAGPSSVPSLPPLSNAVSSVLEAPLPHPAPYAHPVTFPQYSMGMQQTQPEYEGRSAAGSGYGSSESSMSPMSEYSTGSWHAHSLPHLPYHVHTPHPSYSQPPESQLHLRPQSHTPALSEASHSSSSSSPYSLHLPVIRMGEEEEDLSGYVPAPPPYVVDSDHAPMEIDIPAFNDEYRRHDPPRPDSRMYDPEQSGSDNASDSGRSAISREDGCGRVALAPLSSLRNHPYRRRSSVDDKALRLLGPLAH